LIYAGAALAIAWLVAMAVFAYARHSKVTVEKVQAYLHDVDLSKLQGEARARAINELARKINALPVEERREARADRYWEAWFKEMEEEERLAFLDATLPSGFKQMIESFEKLPEDQRRRAVTDAVRRLRESSPERPFGPGGGKGGTNAPPPLNPEMAQRVIQHGLSAFYSQSSAQTKAEVAPFLEELQRAMESGRVFRGR
jgi:hypothetical protein